MVDPVLDNVLAVQRDTAQTFLVDVTFDVVDPDGDDLTRTVEFRRGTTDPWQPATAQTSDRKHDVSPITGVPVAAPGLAQTFVWIAFFDLPQGTFTDVMVRLTVEDPGLSSDQVEFGPFAVTTEIPTQEDELAKALERKAIQARTPLDFLGTGIITPLRRGSRDFVSASEVPLIRSTVRQILGTRAAVGDHFGELKWRPDFGNKLWVLRHRQNSASLRGIAMAYVQEALVWEPRVEVTDVEVERYPLAETNQLSLRVRYQIITENIADNRVILPEFEEVFTVAA